ncbi:hypothetical protein A2U01_0067700, partial [Trifolium medium]|nr:hypothetical protein [Trifolium medium]
MKNKWKNLKWRESKLVEDPMIPFEVELDAREPN